MLSVWQATIVNDTGDVQPGASIEVRDQLTLVLVSLFEDRDSVTPLANPFAADSEGFAQFYAAAGRYRVRATFGSESRTWDDVGMGVPFNEITVPALSVLGRDTNTAGGAVDIAAASNNTVFGRVADQLQFFSVATVIADGSLTYAKINNAAAVSVLGRSANSSGVLADIAAGANDRLLARTSNALSFTQLTVGMVPDATLTYAKIANAAALSVLGRSANSSGVLADIAGSNNQVLVISSSTVQFSSTLPAVSGVNLTALNASNLGSGTVPDARFPSTLPALNGSALTNLTAANVTGSHTLPDGVLSTNVPLKNASNVFTGATQTITANGALLVIDSSDAAGGWLEWKTSGTVRGYLGRGSLVTGGAVTDVAIAATAGGFKFSGNDGTTVHFALDSSGLLTTPNASAAEVGYKGAPSKSWNSSSDNPVLADAGKSLDLASTGTVTIPANGSVGYPIGTFLVFVSRSGSTNTIAITSDTLYLAGSGLGTTGSRTLASGGIAVAFKITATAWLIAGQGLT